MQEDYLKNIREQLKSLAPIKDGDPYQINKNIQFKKKIHNDRNLKLLVIMPIGKAGTLAYRNNMAVFNDILKPCVENCEYNISCYYSDLINESGGIPKQVIAGLLNDDIVIADLRRNNPNVTYELGIRHAIGKRSILVNSNLSEGIFYTKIFRVLNYKVDGSSNQEFYDKLSECIDDIVQNPLKADNPVTENFGDQLAIIKAKPKSGMSKYIYCYRVDKGHHSLGEINNIGDDDLIELNIILEYIDKSSVEQKRMGEVIDSSQDPAHAKPYITKILKKGESKYIINLPRVPVKVTINGKGLASGKAIEEIFELPAADMKIGDVSKRDT